MFPPSLRLYSKCQMHCTGSKGQGAKVQARTIPSQPPTPLRPRESAEKQEKKMLLLPNLQYRQVGRLEGTRKKGQTKYV